ncbi:muscular LMNA-interacting protein isoform X5 [Rhineura floridana]|uniref:muscular LMNA-interacting protein isoform X5 n=1 Tax=Rhineura floridana TaxID=261503 RepID=UPI002AC8493C|nr:muscular LMNA-interacting protein isoform X5 [Rhineura floridana]
MESGEHKAKVSTGNHFWNQKLKPPTQHGEQTGARHGKDSSSFNFPYREQVPSESGFLRFTFVPTFGRLPTQFHISEATTFLAEAAEGPVDTNSQGITGHTTETVIEDQAVGSGSKLSCDPTSCTNSLQTKDRKARQEEMEGNDLFKAEYVFIMDSDEDKSATVGHSYGQGRCKILDAACESAGGESRGHWNAPELSLHTETSYSSASQQKQSQPHKIKTSYKAFAAIPTNTILLEQKALDEPAKMEVSEDKALDTHSEMCSPAQLRQQTEELCAAIDQVLQDPLSMRRWDSSPGSLQNILDSDVGKISQASQRPSGRETRFATLYTSAPAASESKKTKPGVIRPTIVKAKIIIKEEEPIQPNPFRKYLEGTSDPQTDQDPSLFHPFFHTKLSPSTKSPSHPQAVSHADLLTPGPFNHLGSIFGDIHDSSYSPFHRNTLYNKPTHPIVPIPENEALSSKELCSARVKKQPDLPAYQENKDQSKGNFPDNGTSHSKVHCLLRGDLGNVFAKAS